MKTPQEIREDIIKLLKQRKISVNRMLLDCGYNTSLVNDLRKGQMPSADKISNIAKYIGVTSEYLLGNENEDAKLNSEEDFIRILRQKLYGTETHKLSESDKEHILGIAEMLSKIKSGDNK